MKIKHLAPTTIAFALFSAASAFADDPQIQAKLFDDLNGDGISDSPRPVGGATDEKSTETDDEFQPQDEPTEGMTEK